MKIVHIKTRFLNAGAEENTLYSCNWSVAHGDEVYLLIGPSADEEILARVDPRVKIITIPTMVNPIAPLDDFRAFLDIVKVLKEIRPDIVHTHTSKAGIVGRAAARMVGVKGIIHGVHIAPFLNVGLMPRIIYLTAERLVAGSTDAFISVSRGMRDAFLEERLGPPDRHYVIYSGMDLDEFRSPKPIEDWRDLLDCAEGEAKPPVIVMLAALERRKRHVELIRAFERVLRVVPEARLVLAGEGGNRSAVEAAVAASSNPARIRLLGFNSNPGGLIALADIAVHCAAREGLPRVVVQYAAAGVPVVMTNLPGIGEVVTDGVTGFVVGENDFDGLGDALVRLLTDSALLAKVREGSRALDVSAWGIESMCRSNQVVYDTVMAQP